MSALRVELLIAIATASAKAFYIDAQLNLITDELVASLLKITKKDRDDPLWRVFFNGKDVSEFKRPILGGQLAAMRLWPTALESSPHDELKAIGAKLAPLLPVADAAEKDVLAQDQREVEFRNVGRWRQHVDRSNAERKAAFGFLSELPHKQPELKLPSGYADFFFRHDTSRRKANQLRTSEDIAKEIRGLKDRIVDLEQDHEKALEREKEEAEAEEERQKKLAALAQARKDQAAAKAKQAEIEKDLKKGKKK